MFLKNLFLKNFRNHRELRLSFHQKGNLIFGENGVGKTNVLEAITLLSTGKSFRASQLHPLINNESTYFFIQAELIREGVEQTLSIGYDGTKKKIEYNSTPMQSFSYLLGIIPSVLYSPKDINIIMGGPEERRTFLNLNIGQLDPLYVHHLQRYHQCLDQRNSLLKKQSKNLMEFKSFEEPLALSAAYLYIKRKEYLTLLQQELNRKTVKLSKQQEIYDLTYKPSLSAHHKDLVESFKETYHLYRPKELLLKTTLIGPHRDDFIIQKNNTDVKNFCSEGQKRTLLTGLKLAEWEILYKNLKHPPLLCLDDFGNHLDALRHELLERHLEDFGQIFITSPHQFLEREFDLPRKSFHFQF